MTTTNVQLQNCTENMYTAVYDILYTYIGNTFINAQNDI